MKVTTIRVFGIDYISRFWDAQFFACVDCNGTTAGLDFNSLTAITNEVAS